MSILKSPVIVFAFNRPLHLSKCLDSLRANPSIINREVFVVIDGPRNEFDRLAQIETKNILRKYEDLFTLRVITRFENVGLKKSIEQGVTELLKSNQSVIVLEDDLIVAPIFLEFIDTMLNKYSTDDSICQISGYDYLSNIRENDHRPFTAYKLLGGDCLAWATWNSRWTLYNEDSRKVFSKLEKSGNKNLVDRGGVYPFRKMLINNISTPKSWAINWYILNFVHNKFTVYPSRNLALHIGEDGSGSNYFAKKSDPLKIPLAMTAEMDDFKFTLDLVDKELEYRTFLSKYKKGNSKMKRGISKVIKILIRQRKLAKFFLNRWRGFSFNYEGLIFKTQIENQAFEKIISNANSYLEYGSGASTIYVANRGLEKGISIEGDRKWKQVLERKLKSNNVRIVHRNIGLTGPFSDPIISYLFPLSRKRIEMFKLYSEPPKEFLPDVILIGGKFRVACALKTLLHFRTVKHNTWTIIFDDYVERTQYHIVELFFEDKELNGEMAYFTGYADISIEFLRETIKKYELISD